MLKHTKRQVQYYKSQLKNAFLLFLMLVTAEFSFRQAENDNFARAPRFFVHLSAVVERAQCETA